LIRTSFACAYRPHKRNTIPELLWQSYSIKSLVKQNEVNEQKLMYVSPVQYKIPDLQISQTVKAYNEIELLGFPLSLSYFDLLKTQFRGEIFADEMIKKLNSTVKMLGIFVCVKYIKTSNNNYMIFCTWIDAKGNYFDSIHFPKSLKQYPFRGFGVYLMLGKIGEEYSQPTLNVEKFAKMEFKK